MNCDALSFISVSNDWCYDQWRILKNREDSICKLMGRVIMSLLLAIATIVSEISLRIFSWISFRGSYENEYQKLVNLHPINHDLFSEGKKHPKRNRFCDILPNEPTRFKLKEDPDFYFNANWMLEGKAIASQGPLETEIEDFWKMVWHSDVTTLVMLANPIENGRKKCSEYWKTNLLFKLPRILCRGIYVQTKSEQTVFEKGKIKIIERKIQLSKDSQTKIITQYHLQNWPDFGVVPPDVLAELVKLVSKKNSKILAHCSAGVGRTGTFLAAYQAFQKKTRNVFAIASNLRDPYKGRVGMIQTPEQYALANETVQQLPNT